MAASPAEPGGLPVLLEPGATKCCTAIGGSGSPGDLTFHWVDNNLGYFEQLVTEDHFNSYHCGSWATGRPQLSYTVDDWPVLDAHGAASSTCSVL